MSDELTRMFGLQNERVVPFPPAKSHARLWIAGIGLVIVGSLILLITMWPTPVDQGYESTVKRVLQILHDNGVPMWFGYNKLEFSANIVMFVPLGFFVGLILHRRVQWLGLVLVPLVSTGIELTQYLLLEQRYATVPDVIANSLGGWFGVVCAMMLRAAVYARDEKVIARADWRRRYGKRR